MPNACRLADALRIVRQSRFCDTDVAALAA
jgi:hypothetical protein